MKTHTQEKHGMSTITLASPELWLQTQINRAKAGRFVLLDVSISPDAARCFLKRNSGNRKVQERSVLHWEREMRSGRWLASGQAISFDVEGRLVDGQHRLLAVVRLGRSERFDINFGIDPRAYAVIDTGQRKSVGVTLALSGIKNGNVVGAACRIVSAVRHGRKLAGFMMSTAEIIEFANANPMLLECASDAARVRAHLKVFPAGPGSAALFLIKSVAKPELYEMFCDLLCSGVGLEDGDAILSYRGRAAGKTGVGEGLEASALIVKTWNAWVSGKRTKLVVWRPHQDEPFPEVAV